MTDCFVACGPRELDGLRAKDKKLAEVIDRLGPIQRPVGGEVFSELVRSICAQQISSAAAQTVLARLGQTLGEISSENLLAADESILKSCGLASVKVQRLKEISRRVASGELDLETLGELDDQAVIEKLIELPGVGRWTAEMLLLFCLQRPDILSFGDFGIRKGMRMVYRHRKLNHALFEKYRKRLSPFGSTASLYFWAVASGGIPGLRDPGR